MRKALVVLTSGLVLFCASSCSTVTIRDKGTTAVRTPPNYEQSLNFYFWGLSPHHRTVDVSQVCGSAEIKQLQAQDTFLDGFFSFITLGIYRPRTAKVWCQ